MNFSLGVARISVGSVGFAALLKFSLLPPSSGRLAKQLRRPNQQTNMRGAEAFIQSLFTMCHLDDFMPA